MIRRTKFLFAAVLATLLIVGMSAPVGAGSVGIGVAYDSPLTGGSFSDIAHDGVVAAQEDFPIRVREMDQFSPRGRFIGFDTVIHRLASRADMVLAVGFLYSDAVTAIAAERPDVDFVALDALADGLNVASVMFAAHEGSFLVGAAAAMTSESGTIGFIGGVDLPVVLAFEAGFVAGVQHVDPDAEVLVEYVSLLPDFSGFGDPARAYELATGMYQSGADVVFHASGASGLGLFEAARDHATANEHVWAIGVDRDEYLAVDADLQPYILTSMMKRLDVATYEMIAAEVTGTFTAGLHVYGLAEDGVGYTTTGGFIDDLVPELEALKAQIIDGTIVVPFIP